MHERNRNFLILRVAELALREKDRRHAHAHALEGHAHEHAVAACALRGLARIADDHGALAVINVAHERNRRVALPQIAEKLVALLFLLIVLFFYIL